MSEKMSNSTTKASSSGGETSLLPPKNQFQKSGIETVYEVKETKKAYLIRADVPGCPATDLESALVPELRLVMFKAVEPAKPEYNYEGRTFEGMLVLPEGYDTKQAKIRIGDGVIWISIPKIIQGTVSPVPVEVKHVHMKETEDTISFLRRFNGI